MNIGLATAGLVCIGLALGHALTGRTLLKNLPRNLPATRFGDGRLTRGVMVFTWHALTIMLTTTGAVLIAVAQAAPAHDRPLVVSVISAAYATAGALLVWMTRRRPSDLLRAPVWIGFIVIIVLSWLSV